MYGDGWDSFEGNHGRLDYALQEDTQRRAWVTVSWDHFQYDSYFSDRVPISLMSGVPHVTNYHPGYEEVFGSDSPLMWAHSVEELIAKVERMLAAGPTELIELGRAAQVYASAHLTARPVYERLLAEAMGA